MAVMAALPALEALDDLLAQLEAIRNEPSPLGRAKLVRAIDRQARAVLGHVGDEAVWAASNELVGQGATRRRTHDEIAAELGVTKNRVSNAITAYRQWVADVQAGQRV